MLLAVILCECDPRPLVGDGASTSRKLCTTPRLIRRGELRSPAEKAKNIVK